MSKFGNVLTSRQAGKEAYAAFLPTLGERGAEEKIVADFDGVITFTPSWGDEFLTPIAEKYGNMFSITHATNPSVVLTLETLETAHDHRVKFIVE